VPRVAGHKTEIVLRIELEHQPCGPHNATARVLNRSPGPTQIYRGANLIRAPASPRQVPRATSPPYARACLSAGAVEMTSAGSYPSSPCAFEIDAFDAHADRGTAAPLGAENGMPGRASPAAARVCCHHAVHSPSTTIPSSKVNPGEQRFAWPRYNSRLRAETIDRSGRSLPTRSKDQHAWRGSAQFFQTNPMNGSWGSKASRPQHPDDRTNVATLRIFSLGIGLFPNRDETAACGVNARNRLGGYAVDCSGALA
jgi:hypothetical protein